MNDAEKYRPRPSSRAGHVDRFLKACPVHGMVLHARHKTGFDKFGNQRFSDRCLACHSAYNTVHRTGIGNAQPTSSSPIEPLGTRVPARLAPNTAPDGRDLRGPVGGMIAKRAKVIHPEDCRQVPGRALSAGDVLPSGVVLEVTRYDDEVRLEMVGANIHYVALDEPVTVLARVDRDVLDAVSVGVFIANAG